MSYNTERISQTFKLLVGLLFVIGAAVGWKWLGIDGFLMFCLGVLGVHIMAKTADIYLF
jgi:hypothetical protein